MSAGTEDVARSGYPSRRVLVVDDDESIRVLIERSARSFDPPLEFEFATTAEEAYDRMALAAAYDLILADFLLEQPPNGWVLRKHCQRLFPDCAFTMMSSMPLRARPSIAASSSSVNA